MKAGDIMKWPDAEIISAMSEASALEQARAEQYRKERALALDTADEARQLIERERHRLLDNFYAMTRVSKFGPGKGLGAPNSDEVAGTTLMQRAQGSIYAGAWASVTEAELRKAVAHITGLPKREVESERDAGAREERARIMAALETCRPTEQPYTRRDWAIEEKGKRELWDKILKALGQEQKGGK